MIPWWIGGLWRISPMARYAVMLVAVLALAGGLYWKIRSDAFAEEQARRDRAELEAIRNAIRAGDAVDTTPERLRDPDRFQRD